MMTQYISKMKEINNPDKSIIEKVIKININRIFYLAILSIPMRIMNIITFLLKTQRNNDREILWRNGIILSHILSLIFFLIMAIVVFKMRQKREMKFLMIIIQYLMVNVVLVMGTTMASIDQLVTTNITPFLIACITIGAIFIIKPLHSFFIFLFYYIVFNFTIGIFQTDATILLSNKVNGFTSIILGLFLSILLWRHNIVSLQQKEYIKAQHNELEEKNKKLEYFATFDFLTGLVNRRKFEERAVEEISRIKRYSSKACLLILDIDNFKSINDEFGHPVGDAVLRDFASLIKSQLRESDIVSRIGGEEFAILLISTGEKEGKIVAEKIRTNIEKEKFIINNKTINITVSIGLTLFDHTIKSYEEGYKYADNALYSAKIEGKNKVGWKHKL